MGAACYISLDLLDDVEACCALASAEGDAGEVVRGEAIAKAADGFDDMGVADGLEFAAEGADAGGNDVAI